MYMKNKNWYKSKTVWAAVAALVIAISTAAFGDTSSITAVLIAAASAMGIYGRVQATTALK